MVVDFKQDVLELRVKNLLKTEVCIACRCQNIPPPHCRRKWSFAGWHDPRHSLTESLSVYGRPSYRQSGARRRHVQEQEGQGATHLEMQGEAQEGRDYGHGRLAGAESERKKGRAASGECNR